MDRYDTILDATSIFTLVLSASDDMMKTLCSLLAANTVKNTRCDLLNSRKLGKGSLELGFNAAAGL